MNPTKTPHQRLDAMLDYFRENGSFSKFQYPSFFQENREQLSDILPLVHKLEQDGYVYDNENGEWVISFEGTLFDGYQADKERQELHQEAQRSMIAFQHGHATAIEQYAHKLNRLTGWLVAGTLIAAVYYLIQIIEDGVRVYNSF